MLTPPSATDNGMTEPTMLCIKSREKYPYEYQRIDRMYTTYDSRYRLVS